MTDALNPGWLNRQFERVSRDVATWPEYMKREAGFTMADPRDARIAELVDALTHIRDAAETVRAARVRLHERGNHLPEYLVALDGLESALNATDAALTPKSDAAQVTPKERS